MSGHPTTSTVSEREASTSKEGMSFEEKIGMAKKFDREMKDYAKATVKEFLGIYGYEEDVDINIDESESHKTGETSTSQAVDKQTETEPTTSTVSTMTCVVDKGSDRPVSSVSISSSTSNASNEDSGSVKQEENPRQNLCLSTFSWDEYLAETKGIAAPWTCFKQAATPPYNGFQCGMKLEAADPRNEGAVCVATVVGVIGSRLRLRFDGCGNLNDIWRVIDSGDIHPVGWCEGNGGVLKPPVGFRMEGSSFKSFLKKNLANGELAPFRLFKKEPNTPKVNLFCPTFKLEAVDLKNPALICVGTVVDVIGDDVMVAFDGFKDTAYTYPFYSRDIFPPGWCYFSGHPLQLPGPEYRKFKTSASQKERSVLHVVKPLDDDDEDDYEPRTAITLSNKQRTVRAISSVENADSPSEDPNVDHALNFPVPVELFVNFSCEFGSYLDPSKVAELRPVFRGNVRDVLQSSIQAIVNVAYNPSIVIGFLRPGRGKIVIRAKHGKDTYTCCLQSVDHIWVFWNVFGRFTDNLRCCKNLFSSEKLHGVCPKCNDQGRKRLMEEKQLAEQEKLRNDLRMEEIRKQELRNEERRMEEVRNERMRNQELARKEQQREEPVTKMRRIVRDEELNEVSDIGSTSSPLTWSIDEVVEYFAKSDISKYAELFKQHEIDGGALLLLNRETIMSCMQFKLGPALKLLNHIAELKTKFNL
ncbi:sex comb on midleg-like protein 2 isoform X2 [Dendronephthya gigantea]|uniref:sex comb on midleg-like protein 2 isoform X2 n=1 Tax=Dendronephthya gigantea TaxID=151771 RepID=UPI00106D85A4|nr:sex comb on midleg-like protein 2 isoform X2 [Dendronephthya gigantea]